MMSWKNTGYSLRMAWVAAVALGLTACAAVDDDGLTGLEDGQADGDEGTDPAFNTSTFNFNRVAETDEITDADAMTVDEVQQFLEVTPYGWRSILADYSSNGKTAAEAIVAAAQTHRINPIAILTRTQMEQSLIGKQSASQKALNYGMGCGCPDGKACDPKYKGYDKQVECMASKYRWYFDDQDTKGVTVSGWGIGVTKKTLDKFSITPENQATAGLYTYTPWRYAQESHAKIWQKYAKYVGYTGPQAPTPPDPPMPPDPPTTPPDPPTTPPDPPTTPPDPPAGEIIIDNNNAWNGLEAWFSASSNWTTSSATSGYHEDGYAYRSTGSSTDLAEFSVHMSADTDVIVEAWWTGGSNRSVSAPFVILNADGNTLGVDYVDQSQSSGQWVEVGRYRMTAGWNTVGLSRWTDPGYVVVADAVRVRPAN